MGSDGPVTFDVAGWPVVRVVQQGVPSDAEIDAFAAALRDEVVQRGTPFCFLLDLRRAVKMPAEVRTRLQDAILSDGVKPLLRAEAMLMDSTFKRLLFSALLKLRNPPMPMRVFGDESNARSWLTTHLK